MDWQKVERTLGRSFRAKPQEIGESVVVYRRCPLKLTPVIERALGDDEEDLVYDLGVHGILEEERTAISLLGFYWESLGPMSWVAEIVLVGTRRRRYLCVWDENRAVAAVEPWDDPLALSAAVTAYVARNGRRHGDWLFGSLPHEVSNHRPDLLPTPVVKQALFDYMQWAESVDQGAWSMLASEHYGRLVEPSHLQRSLDVLETFLSLDLDEIAAESEAMPDHARQRLFDEWFATAYEADDDVRAEVTR